MHLAVTDIADNIDLGSGISGKLSFNTLPLSYSLLAFLHLMTLCQTQSTSNSLLGCWLLVTLTTQWARHKYRYKRQSSPYNRPPRAQRESKGIAIFVLDLGARRGGWSAPRPATLPLGKTLYQLYRRLGGPQGRSGRTRKISFPPGFDPRIVQLVANRYTYWATRHTKYRYRANKCIVVMWLYLWTNNVQ
jgi:hypothetical protein